MLDLLVVHVVRAGKSIPAGGVLGLSFLKLFEIDIDFKRKRISFHPVGHIDSGLLDVSGTACLQCTPIKGR